MNYLKANFRTINSKGFSLIEVVLAIGIFLVTVLALVGLLGPTLQSVDEVERTDEISSVVNTVNAFLQNSPEIAGTGTTSKFDIIYNTVRDEQYATIFVFSEYYSNTSNAVRLRVGFSPSETTGGETLGAGASIPTADFNNAAGAIFRVILTPSSAIPTPSGSPTVYRSATRSTATDTYTLNATLAQYLEGFFAMEVRIYAEDPGNTFTITKGLNQFLNVEPLFSYDTAIVR